MIVHCVSIISDLRVQRYNIFSVPPNFPATFFKKKYFY